MQTHVALLYSIVLSPGRRVVMSELRRLAADLGFDAPRTVVATGNLVFAADGGVAAIEEQLETGFAAAFGRHVDIIVRTAAAWDKLVAANPFPQESQLDPSHVIVRVSRRAVSPAILPVLEPYRSESERIVVAGGDLWAYFGERIAQSKLAAAMTPKRLGGPGTARNWNTVQRIAALVDR